MRARPKYPLSSDIPSHKVDTKLPYELPLYLVGPKKIVRKFVFGIRCRGELVSAGFRVLRA